MTASIEMLAIVAFGPACAAVRRPGCEYSTTCGANRPGVTSTSTVLPDDTPAHAYQTAVDIASLAPDADFAVYPWKDPPELKARTISRVRSFLKVHLPMTAAR
jgi:hypothetical protein